MTLVAEHFVSLFTLLGDNAKWKKAIFAFSFDMISIDALVTAPFAYTRLISNALMRSISAVVYHIAFGNPFIIDFVFQSIAFYGIYKLLSATEVHARSRLAVLMLFPSFNIWSSIASKESLIVFGVCIIGAYFLRLSRGEGRFGFLEILAIFIIFIMKNQYFAPIGFLIGVGVLSTYLRQRTLFVAIAGTVSIWLLWLNRDRVDELALQAAKHWIGFGHTTREMFFVNQYDVFWKAPEGMWLAFSGPTISESTKGVLHAFSFVESTLLVATIIYFVLPRLLRIPVHNLFLGFMAVFWVLFVNFPVGVMNPGSAVRYRTGFIALIFIVVAVLLSRDGYMRNGNLSRLFFRKRVE